MSESLYWVHIYTFAIHVFGLSFAVSSVEDVWTIRTSSVWQTILCTFPHTEFFNEHLFKSHVEVLLGCIIQSFGGAAKAGRLCTFFLTCHISPG